MAITITGITLKSVITRVRVGVRKINLTGTVTPGGIIGFFSRMAGFAFGLITKFFPLSVSSIFQMLVQAYFTIKNFDWNQTNAQLEAKIKANNNAIKTGLAPIIGASLGWGTVRLANFAIGKLAPTLPGSTSGPTKGINIPVISAKVGLALAEEGNEEIRGAVAGWLNTVRSSLQNNLLASFVLTARNFRFFGMEPVTAPLPNGSFASRIETQIERLPDNWEDLAEEVLEEFEEAIIEAGYVVTFEIDDYFIAQRAAAKGAGPATSVGIGINAGGPTT